MTETQLIAGRILLALQEHGLATGYSPNRKPHVAVQPFTWVNDGLVRPDGFSWSYPFPGKAWIAWVDGTNGEQACLHCSFNHIDTMEEVRVVFYCMKQNKEFCQDVLSAIAQDDFHAGKGMRLEAPKKKVVHTLPIGDDVSIRLNDGSVLHYCIDTEHWRLTVKDLYLAPIRCDGVIGDRASTAQYILDHLDGATAIDLHSQNWWDDNGEAFIAGLQAIVDWKPTPIKLPKAESQVVETQDEAYAKLQAEVEEVDNATMIFDWFLKTAREHGWSERNVSNTMCYTTQTFGENNKHLVDIDTLHEPETNIAKLHYDNEVPANRYLVLSVIPSYRNEVYPMVAVFKADWIAKNDIPTKIFDWLVSSAKKHGWTDYAIGMAEMLQMWEHNELPCLERLETLTRETNEGYYGDAMLHRNETHEYPVFYIDCKYRVEVQDMLNAHKAKHIPKLKGDIV